MTPAAAAAIPPPEHAPARLDLVGLGRAELAAEMAEIGEKPFRARQLWHWIYHRGARGFEAMANVPKSLRRDFAARYRIGRPAAAADLLSADGTRKWLLRLDDGREVETVHIPESGRGALCVSSQVGCALACRFCRTGTQKLVRNLGAGEIVGQMLAARDAVGEWAVPAEGRTISNVVMMGMGEPLLNYDNVVAALGIFVDPEGIALSWRRITLSTAGVVPMIERLGRDLDVGLAVSLHAVRDELRDELVPLNRKYPIALLLDACRRYPGLRNSRRITFEYVMLDGVNDGDSDARELVRLLAGIPAKVNLIPFNPWPGAPYACSSGNRMRAFAGIVNDAGYAAPIRAPRGRDIMAACGQLRSASARGRRAANGGAA